MDARSIRHTIILQKTRLLAFRRLSWYTSMYETNAYEHREMSSETLDTSRAGKYCPRCRTMARREDPVCRQCGHQFRSGTSQAVAETSAPDPVNRTMQFVLPPLPARTPAPVGQALAPSPDRGRRRTAAIIAAIVLSAAACLAAALLWSESRRAPAVSETSPAGQWETVLHGSAAANARLEFRFDAGGGGVFSWQESGIVPHAGQTSLRWKQNLDGTLFLSLTPPVGGDQVAQTLAGIFSRPAWTWRVDRTQHRLVLGTLVFTETK